MGTFNYSVDIDKVVDINVDIDLNVEKFVNSFTNITGYLAVAEASADAFGGPGGGTGTGRRETADRAFIIDGFDDQQEVDINPGADVLDIFDEGTAVGPTFINPDGETFRVSRTEPVENSSRAPLSATESKSGIDYLPPIFPIQHLAGFVADHPRRAAQPCALMREAIARTRTQ